MPIAYSLANTVEQARGGVSRARPIGAPRIPAGVLRVKLLLALVHTGISMLRRSFFPRLNRYLPLTLADYAA
jgi:hypothetical protein